MKKPIYFKFKIIIILSFIFLNQCENPTESKNDEYHVKLWNNYYSIEETTELSINGENILGQIPPKISELVNLTSFFSIT